MCPLCIYICAYIHMSRLYVYISDIFSLVFQLSVCLKSALNLQLAIHPLFRIIGTEINLHVYAYVCTLFPITNGSLVRILFCLHPQIYSYIHTYVCVIICLNVCDSALRFLIKPSAGEGIKVA